MSLQKPDPEQAQGSLDPMAPLITREFLARYFHMPISQAAKELGVCTTMLKKMCRKNGVPRWPFRKIHSLDRMIANMEQTLRANQEDPAVQRELSILRARRTQIISNPEAGSKRRSSKSHTDGHTTSSSSSCSTHSRKGRSRSRSRDRSDSESSISRSRSRSPSDDRRKSKKSPSIAVPMAASAPIMPVCSPAPMFSPSQTAQPPMYRDFGIPPPPYYEYRADPERMLPLPQPSLLRSAGMSGALPINDLVMPTPLCSPQPQLQMRAPCVAPLLCNQAMTPPPLPSLTLPPLAMDVGPFGRLNFPSFKF